MSCHVPVPPRTAKLPVRREADFLQAQLQSTLSTAVNTSSSCAQSVFCLGFFFGGRDDLGPSTLVNCVRNKT